MFMYLQLAHLTILAEFHWIVSNRSNLFSSFYAQIICILVAHFKINEDVIHVALHAIFRATWPLGLGRSLRIKIYICRKLYIHM